MKSPKCLALAVWVFLLSQCTMFSGSGPYADAKALIGEAVRQARTGEFPYVTALIKVNRDNPRLVARFCSGTLIAGDKVITVEHCLLNEVLSDVRVVVGSNDFRSGDRHTIHSWISYNQWAEQHGTPLEYPTNDIAIIKLSQRVSGNVRLAALTRKSRSQIIGMLLEIAGWGVKITGEVPTLMETGKVRILRKNACEGAILNVFHQTIEITPNIFCSSVHPYVLMTQGDSGDPIMDNNELVAISSGTFVGSHFHPENINIHVSIPYYKKFIRDVLKNY